MLTLAPDSFEWALTHVERHGDTDVFPTPFEYQAIRHDWNDVRDFLSAQNVLTWQVRARRQLLAPKARYGFRVITQLDPLDLLVFTALVYEIGADIETKRVPDASKVVFSYRFKPTADGDFFDQQVGYRGFVQACCDKETADAGVVYVAVTDISDFYSRIYHHRLENRLRNATPKTAHVNAIMGLLSSWNASESFGIPIGNAASRLLGEATLSDVDEALLANGVNFVRFNDDYRIFARTHAEAYRHLAFLADTLYRNHGLTLQRQKTDVLLWDTFVERFLATPIDRELDSLHTRFDEIIQKLGLSDPYEPIDPSSLPPGIQDLIDALNLQDLLREELQREKRSVSLTGLPKYGGAGSG
ncbi:MAG: RNA-directed DNA polymerase [Gammaproteobacteria bacterium]